MISKESEVTGPWAREYRQEKGMTQSQFWGVACVTKATACGYESGLNIPQKVKRLVFLHHIVGIPVNGNISEMKAMSAKLRDLAKADKKARARLLRAADLLNNVGASIQDVLRELEEGE